MRSHRPGAHAAQWAQLLDELAQAKACLSDSAEKSKYDASLRTQQPGGPGQDDAQASTSAARPEIATVNQMPDLFPPGMEPSPPATPAAESAQISDGCRCTHLQTEERGNCTRHETQTTRLNLSGNPFSGNAFIGNPAATAHAGPAKATAATSSLPNSGRNGTFAGRSLRGGCGQRHGDFRPGTRQRLSMHM